MQANLVNGQLGLPTFFTWKCMLDDMDQVDNGADPTDSQSDKQSFEFPRRSFLKIAGAGLAPLGLGTAFGALNPSQPLLLAKQHLPGLITRQKEPENLESPFSALESRITPNDLFYVRTHFATPHLKVADWKLQIEGAVNTPLTLTYDELKALPSKTVTATLECAGNSRVYLTPPARGVQWEQGAVSTAEWTGVPLSVLLEKAGMHPDAIEVVLEGADSGELKDPPHPGAALHFSRSLPLEKALQKNVLIVYEMNGEPLPVGHGFPVRAIVPEWFAVASVKWLTRLVVVTKPFHGYFQTIDYAYWKHENGLAHRVPITSLLVKSQISRPEFRESVAAGSTYKVTGAAWTGEHEVVKIELSSDGGHTWSDAHWTSKSETGAWRLWEFEWKVPSTTGIVTLASRATDSAGNVQPATRDLDRENYLINQVIPIEVHVK